jgi:hypothetical protein
MLGLHSVVHLLLLWSVSVSPPTAHISLMYVREKSGGQVNTTDMSEFVFLYLSVYSRIRWQVYGQ